jgi:hypothetical protein
MENTARLFNCNRCHKQVTICSQCDRGNIYCSETCSSLARTESLRKAAHRYQATLRGKHNHARRQKRYIKKKMTHHASTNCPSYDELLHGPKEGEQQASSVISNVVYCHFCGRFCSPFLRIDFLQHCSYQQHKSINHAWPFAP